MSTTDMYFINIVLLLRIGHSNKNVQYSNSLNPLPQNDDFSHTRGKKPFENFVGKEENAGNQHFLLFT